MTFEELHRAIREVGWLWGVEPLNWQLMDGVRFNGAVWRGWVRRPDGYFEQEGSDPLGCLRMAYTAATTKGGS